MRYMKTKCTVCLVVVLLISLTLTFAKGNGIIEYAMSIEAEPVKMGDSITLAGAVTFDLPEDWVKISEGDSELKDVGYGTPSINRYQTIYEDIMHLKKLLTDRLQEFYVSWCKQSLTNMLEYCASEWKEKQTGDLKAQLLTCIPEGTPLICTLKSLDIKEDSAVAETEILIDHNDGKDPLNYRFSIQMIREGDEWFVDPESLLHYEEAVEEEKAGITESAYTPAKKTTLAIPDGFESDEEVNTLCRETLLGFMSGWAYDSLDDMLDYCSLAWKTSNTPSQEVALFALNANRTPISYTLNDIKTKGDDAYAELVAVMHRNNGKEPENYRMIIHLVREDGKWFVDPDSIQNYEIVEATSYYQEDSGQLT